MKDDLWDIIVVGGGVAGLAAAFAAARRGMSVLLLEKGVAGGQTAVLEEVDAYPGIASVDGWRLTQVMVRQAEEAFCRIVEGAEVVRVVREDANICVVFTAAADRFRCRAVILAPGGRPRPLGVAGEKRLARRGVHTCAQCAGPRYKGLRVVVVGSHDAAVIGALHLHMLGCQVTLVTGERELQADVFLLQRLAESREIHILHHTMIEELAGDETLACLTMKNLLSGRRHEFCAAALFVYRGMLPNSEMVEVVRDRLGFVRVDRNQATSLDSVFAAGHVTAPWVPVGIAVGDGTRAGLAAVAAVGAQKSNGEG